MSKMNNCCSLPSVNQNACDNCLNNPNKYNFTNPSIYEGMRYMNPEEEKLWEDVMEELCKNGKPIKFTGDNN